MMIFFHRAPKLWPSGQRECNFGPNCTCVLIYVTHLARSIGPLWKISLPVVSPDLLTLGERALFRVVVGVPGCARHLRTH